MHIALGRIVAEGQAAPQSAAGRTALALIVLPAIVVEDSEDTFGEPACSLWLAVEWAA